MKFSQNLTQPELLLLTIAVSLAACTSGTASKPETPVVIGMVTRAQGFPSVIRNSRDYILDAQSRIYRGDIVQTDSSSRAHIEMVDDSRFEVGADSHLVFNVYDYDEDSGTPTARLTLTDGSIRITTNFGELTRRTAYQLQTPVGMISIVSGDIWSGFIIEDNTLDVAMLSGRGIRVTNEHGAVDVNRSGTGTTVIGGAAPQSPRAWSNRKIDRATASTAIRSASP